MKILLIGGVPDSLIRFRGPLIERLVEQDHDVLAMAGHEDPAATAELQRIGARFGTYALQRDGTSIGADVRTCRSLVGVMRRERPDLVIAYTAKPVIWGGIAARLTRVPAFHALITGLGAQFDSHPGREWMTRVLKRLYRSALARADSVIFQNDDDRRRLLSFGALDERVAHRIDGSGVDTRLYRPTPLPAGAPVLLMAARLLGAKGVREFAAAARIIRRRHPEVRFQLAGGPWTGPDVVPIEEVQAWHEEGVVEHLGLLPEIRTPLERCHVYVLPSYYGEGLPRSILEAMAVGRPVLTTDSVGCREPVQDGVTGMLVEPRSVDALVAGIERMLQARDRWPDMADAALAAVAARYDVDRVNDELLRILGLEPAAP